MAYLHGPRLVQWRTCANPISLKLVNRTKTADCGFKGRLAMTRAPSACMFTPFTRTEPESLEILASKRTFSLWLTRRSGCRNGRFCGPRPVTAKRTRFRMRNAEAIVCAIDSIMGCAAREDKYQGFPGVASTATAKQGKSTAGSSPR